MMFHPVLPVQVCIYSGVNRDQSRLVGVWVPAQCEASRSTTQLVTVASKNYAFMESSGLVASQTNQSVFHCFKFWHLPTAKYWMTRSNPRVTSSSCSSSALCSIFLDSPAQRHPFCCTRPHLQFRVFLLPLSKYHGFKRRTYV
jgi:hypothetical protein